MRAILSVLLALVLISGTACGGGSGSTSPDGHTAGGIQGPQVINEGSSAQYSVERTAEASAAYQWTISPATAGSLASPVSASTTFNAASVDHDTPVEIRVAITPNIGSPAVSKIDVTVKNIDNPGLSANRPPVASALAEPLAIHPGESIRFSDNSIDPDGNDDIVTREWDLTYDPSFGFQTDSTEKEPYIRYPDEGDFQVQLRVTDSQGSSDMLDQPINILVTTGSLNPTAKATCFPNPTTICETIQFQNNGSYPRSGESITKYEWDWDNDGTFDQEGSFVEHSWDTAGTYSVQFRVTDDGGQTGTLAGPIVVVVRNADPVPDFSVDTTNARVGQEVRFNAGNSYDPDCGGHIAEWEWDWENDGIFDATGSSIDMFFDYPGIYEVMLRVTDDEGASVLIGEPVVITIDPGRAVTWGGSGEDHNYDVAVDAEGNTYVTGCFSGTVDFDPGAGERNETSGAATTAFLSKFDSNSNFIWVTTWGDDEYSFGNDVDVTSAGYIYVAGSTTLTKFNQNGSGLWTYDTGAIGEGVTIDDYTGIFVTGHHTPTGQNYDDCFLSNLDFDGSLKWHNTWGNTGCDMAYAVDSDSIGNPIVTGHFSGLVDFDPGDGIETRQSVDATDSFIVRFTSDGYLDWVSTFEATAAFSIAIDSSDHIYVTGFYEGETDFDPGPGLFTCEGNMGSYLGKFDIIGDLVWVQGWSEWNPPPPPGGCGDPGYSVVCGPNGNVYVAGAFEGSVDFDPTGGTDVRNGGGAYLALYTSTGYYQRVLTWGTHNGVSVDTAWAVTTDIEGNIFVAGDYAGVVDFGVDVQELHGSEGGNDSYVMTIPFHLDW